MPTDKHQLVSGSLAGYEPVVGAALWRLEDTRARTLRVLGDLPENFVDFETRGNTVGTILYHVALIETDWLCSEILEEPYPDDLKALLPLDDRDADGVLTLVRDESLEQHLGRLRSVRTTLLDKLRGMTAEDFVRPRKLPDYDVTPEWVLHHLSQHEAEHRGEIGSVIDAIKRGDV
jgi:uncharacterized damage-inducible protein DinB